MKPIVLAVVGGALFALSLPPYNVEWLSWFAITCLLLGAHRCHPLRALELGMLASGVCGVIHVRWLPEAGVLSAYTPFLWVMLLFGAVATVATIARRGHTSWSSGPRWVLLVASVGVSVEWLTTFSPLPLHIALCQHKSWLIQIASLTGIWGVSFLLWWTNAALADAVLQRRLLTTSMGTTLALLALTIVYSGASQVSYDAAHLPPTEPDFALVRVAAIQDMGDGKTRRELTRRAAANGAQLVVWPEYCLGKSFQPDNPHDPTLTLARKLKIYLVAGYIQVGQPKPHNCAALIGPDGKVKGVHRKIHLYSEERHVVQRGDEATAFDTALGKIGMEICFDNCFTGVTRRMAQSGAHLITLPTADPLVTRNILHHLHAAVLPFRAVENHVPFVQANTYGLSQIVDATGRITARAPMAKADVLMGDVILGDGQGTFFTRWGDWLAYGCLLIVAWSSVSMMRQERTEGR